MKVLILLLIIIVTIESVTAQKEPFKIKYTNHTELGVLLGRAKFNYGSQQNQVDSRTSLTAQTFNGIQINQRLSAGVTVGMDWYKTALINPIAAGIRFDLTKRTNSRLFASADAGYGFGWFHEDSDGYDTKGGLMLNPGVGMKYGKPGGNAFTITLSYKRQEVHADKPLQWEQTVRYEDRVYNRLALRIGMNF
ncbi:hypothetical protein [Dyadobacter sp. NIV53]|uniref:hypothetical protein n=1 Tax=Dyadobacter sp. NIV53 TaxID=2861765 RepID=UPI001C849357|nr:hypothetical protein [Dyadobacter sp. NIV53]